MQHQIPTSDLGPLGETMAKAISACVHCGFCLPTCPTYRVLGQESDSPRGRIYLMKEVLEGQMAAAEAEPAIDRCLGCMGCVTSCPSGVEYGDLLSPFRDFLRGEKSRSTSRRERWRRWLLMRTLPYPARLYAATRLGQAARPLRRLLPTSLRSMLRLLPESVERPRPDAEIIPACGQRRARVALVAGCAQRVLAPQIHRASIRVLSRNGVEVVVPPDQGCCGSLAWHSGEAGLARHQARRNLHAFPADVDAVVTNAAGCGSGMRDYPSLFAGHSDHDAARAFAARVCDISVFLDQLGILPPPPLAKPLRLAYHDACHLRHAQGVYQPPRRLLAAIPNLTLVEIPHSEVCCGSAGTYNLDHPETAAALGRSKAASIRQTAAAAVAAGNVGCLLQIRAYLEPEIAVRHTVEILAQAYDGGISHSPAAAG